MAPRLRLLLLITQGAFGRVAMAVVVKDPTSGLSKGSAFVKFDSPAAAQACVQVSV